MEAIIGDKSLLTILVTCYNRANFVDVILDRLYDYQQHGLIFNVLVSDDNSSDNTKAICDKWKFKIHGYKYVCTSLNKGMDNNFRLAYESFTTDYCWMMGDTRIISFDELKMIICVLNKREYTALILRCRDDITKVSKVYTDINNLMSDMGWHITNNASCVIPKKFINKNIYKRYLGTTFLHMGIMVDNLCLLDTFKVAYLPDVHVCEIIVPGFKKIGWTAHPFYNFGKCWYEFVMSLPNQIDVDIKHKVLKDHDKHAKFVSVSRIIRNRIIYGPVYKYSYFKNRRFIRFVSDTPLWLYDLKFLLPLLPFKMLKYLYFSLLNKKHDKITND